MKRTPPRVTGQSAAAAGCMALAATVVVVEGLHAPHAIVDPSAACVGPGAKLAGCALPPHSQKPSKPAPPTRGAYDLTATTTGAQGSSFFDLERQFVVVKSFKAT